MYIMLYVKERERSAYVLCTNDYVSPKSMFSTNAKLNIVIMAKKGVVFELFLVPTLGPGLAQALVPFWIRFHQNGFKIVTKTQKS